MVATIDNDMTQKVRGEIRLMAVTQKQLSEALKLSPARINELCDEKILVRDESARNGQVMLFDSLIFFEQEDER